MDNVVTNKYGGCFQEEVMITEGRIVFYHSCYQTRWRPPLKVSKSSRKLSSALRRGPSVNKLDLSVISPTNCVSETPAKSMLKVRNGGVVRLRHANCHYKTTRLCNTSELVGGKDWPQGLHNGHKEIREILGLCFLLLFRITIATRQLKQGAIFLEKRKLIMDWSSECEWIIIGRKNTRIYQPVRVGRFRIFFFRALGGKPVLEEWDTN